MTSFLSYKYTGVSKENLKVVTSIISHLRNCGLKIFCNLEREEFYIKEQLTVNQIMQDCFYELDKCISHITFIAPDMVASEGMMIELGYAIKKGLRTLLLIPDNYVGGVSLRAVVDDIIEYSTFEDLEHKLTKFYESN